MIDQLTQRQGKQVKRDLFKTVVADREGKALAKRKEIETPRVRDMDRQTWKGLVRAVWTYVHVFFLLLTWSQLSHLSKRLPDAWSDFDLPPEGHFFIPTCLHYFPFSVSLTPHGMGGWA